MSVYDIMEDIRQNVDGFFKVRQVYRVISAKEITEDDELNNINTTEEEE
jgi:hypothetical protein